MAKMKVTNTTTSKSEFKDFDEKAMLSAIRKQLGAFMKAGDVFIDGIGDPVDVDDEEDLALKTIVENAAFKIAEKAATDGPEPDTGPEPDDPPIDTPGTKDPADNNAPFGGGTLPSIEIEEAVWPEDRDGLDTGIMVSGQNVKMDHLGAMKVGQVRNLLSNNNIWMNKKKGTTLGLVLSQEGFSSASEKGIQCTEVNVLSPDKTNYFTYSYQYDEFVSRLHMSANSTGETGVGIPLIFDVSASHQIQQTQLGQTQDVSVSGSHLPLLSPGAGVVSRRQGLAPPGVRKKRQGSRGRWTPSRCLLPLKSTVSSSPPT